MNKIIWLSLLFLILQQQSFAGKADSIATTVFKLIYQEHLEEAEQELEIQKNNLNEFYYLLLNLDLHWWKYRTTYSKQNTRNLELLLERLNHQKAENDKQKIKLLLVKSYLLRYEQKKLKLLSVIATRSEIRNLIDQIEITTEHTSLEEQKLLKVYFIMFQYIENVNFLFKQIAFDDRRKQLQLMEEFAADNNEMLSSIARFFVARMYQKIEKQPETGLEHYIILTRKYPNNTTFAEYKTECENKI
jgi:hypothetical protein